MQSPNPFDADSFDADAQRGDSSDADRSREADRGAALNPYDAPIDPQAVTAPQFAQVDPRLRIWTAMLVPAVALLSFLLFSGLMLVVAMAVVHGRLDSELLHSPKAFQAVSESRIGLFLVLVIPQLAMLAPALIAAGMSPTPTLKRLGLVRGHWPLWGWVAAACATPLIGLVSTVVIGMFLQESENLKLMSEIFRGHGESGFLIPLTLMVGATPAVCEELLFRGYVQTRLTRARGPLVGIVIASCLFAVFHLDWIHIIAVLPLGLYLGYVTWRSGSLIPAMLGHFVNNAISVIAVVIAPQGETDALDLPVAMVSLSIIGTGIIGVFAVITASVIYGRPCDDVA